MVLVPTCGINEEYYSFTVECICILGYIRNSIGICELGINSIDFLKYIFSLNYYFFFSQNYLHKATICGPNEIYSSMMGGCQCVMGYRRNAAGNCVRQDLSCGVNETYIPAARRCQCSTGYTRNTNGDCVLPEPQIPPPTPPGECGANGVLNPDTAQCICIPGYNKNATGTCIQSKNILTFN